MPKTKRNAIPQKLIASNEFSKGILSRLYVSKVLDLTIRSSAVFTLFAITAMLIIIGVVIWWNLESSFLGRKLKTVEKRTIAVQNFCLSNGHSMINIIIQTRMILSITLCTVSLSESFL